jgi:hypothetical protein
MSLTMRAKHRRWSDENHHFGPFTYSRCRDGYKPLAIVLNSGAGENPGCHVRLNGLGHTLIIELPQVIKPWRQWVKTGHYEWAKSKDSCRSSLAPKPATAQPHRTGAQICRGQNGATFA